MSRIWGGIHPPMDDIRGAYTPRYERHRSEQTLLYQRVETHYPEFCAQLDAQGRRLPAYVRQPSETPAVMPNTFATLAGQALETILQHLAQQESPSLSRANVARGPPEQTVLFKRYITPFDLIANDLRKHGRTRCACWAILT